MLTIQQNRKLYLSALRSGKYKKGTIHSDNAGKPIFRDGNLEGYCACALMHDLFYNEKLGISPALSYRKALGITSKQCRYIQHELNDRLNLSFIEIADILENQIFL